MAIRFTHRFRPALVTAALATTAVIAPSVAFAAPHQSPHQAPKDPKSIPDVQKQLGELALQNTQIVEQFNQAGVLVAKRKALAAKAQQASVKANADYLQAQTAFAQTIQVEYENGSLGTAGALLDSSSGANYLERITTLNLLSGHNADVVQRVSTARATATKDAAQAKEMLAAATKEAEALQVKKSAVAKQITKYKNLLATLNSAQRAAYQNATAPKATKKNISAYKQIATSAGSHDAQVAVQYALDQVGKPYVWGASGPGSYDCSGLTMASWRHAGVSLPHSSADQIHYGTPVNDPNNLVPGDLVFFYHPISHVTIYIGDGMMVSAPTEGEDVTVVPLSHYMNEYAGATHIG